MPAFQFFDDPIEFSAAFEGRRVGAGREDRLSNAAHYLAGTLHGTDFRLFKNGGLPLLERRYGPLREEIVLCPAKTATGSHYPLTLRVHLCHEGVKSIRQRYWQPAILAPEKLASGNAGALRGGFVLWDMAYENEALRHQAHYVQEWVLPWFELMENPMAARDQLFSVGIPLVEGSAALEWVLAEFGRYEASDYLEAMMKSNEKLRERVLRRLSWNFDHGVRMRQTEDEIEQLAVLAEAFDLRKRSRRIGHYSL